MKNDGQIARCSRLARWWFAVWLFFISAICVACGLWSVWHPGVGWETLLFFVAAGALPMVLFASEIIIKKDGLHLKGIGISAQRALSEQGLGGKRKGENLTDGDDPEKGKWGGQDYAEGFRLTASVAELAGTPEWFSVRLVVGGTPTAKADASAVRFHLHPTFKDPHPRVALCGGKAVVELVAWGAFTVGAEVLDDGGRTMATLELDLATLPEAPAKFLER